MRYRALSSANDNLQIIDGKDIPGLRQAVCLKTQGWHPRVAPGGRQTNAKDALLFFYLFIWDCICIELVCLISKAYLFCTLLQAVFVINKIGMLFFIGLLLFLIFLTSFNNFNSF